MVLWYLGKYNPKLLLIIHSIILLLHPDIVQPLPSFFLQVKTQSIEPDYGILRGIYLRIFWVKNFQQSFKLRISFDQGQSSHSGLGSWLIYIVSRCYIIVSPRYRLILAKVMLQPQEVACGFYIHGYVSNLIIPLVMDRIVLTSIGTPIE